MLVELVAQPHCLYLLCTEAMKYVYTFLMYFGCVFWPQFQPALADFEQAALVYPLNETLT